MTEFQYVETIAIKALLQRAHAELVQTQEA